MVIPLTCTAAVGTKLSLFDMKVFEKKMSHNVWSLTSGSLFRFSAWLWLGFVKMYLSNTFSELVREAQLRRDSIDDVSVSQLKTHFDRQTFRSPVEGDDLNIYLFDMGGKPMMSSMMYRLHRPLMKPVRDRKWACQTPVIKSRSAASRVLLCPEPKDQDTKIRSCTTWRYGRWGRTLSRPRFPPFPPGANGFFLFAKRETKASGFHGIFPSGSCEKHLRTRGSSNCRTVFDVQHRVLGNKLNWSFSSGVG